MVLAHKEFHRLGLTSSYRIAIKVVLITAVNRDSEFVDAFLHVKVSVKVAGKEVATPFLNVFADD